jgi:hypothetical protein
MPTNCKIGQIDKLKGRSNKRATDKGTSDKGAPETKGDRAMTSSTNLLKLYYQQISPNFFF